MLTLTRNADDFIIEHWSTTSDLMSCRFNKSHLPANALTHLQSLRIFKQSRATSFILTQKQDDDFNDLLIKIQHRDIAYRFAVELHQTYLVELIHLITKVQHDHLPLFE